MRGNGESDGLMLDEYLPQELADGVEVIAWIASQPWCSGSVGMIGISWGGFNGLQIAALRPPALKAVVTVCSTDDRYADDIHYRGGCLLNDNLAWSATMMAYSSRPPDPALVGEAWRDMWLERLRNMPFLAANWMEHQRRDDYWRHGSVCEDFSAIEVPVLAVGGWHDAYSNAIPRLVAGLKSPAAGLIGPWGHRYPQIGVPGPAMDFVAEVVAWWDRWLAGHAAPDLPALRAYMLDGPDTREGPDERAGLWVSEPSWPSPNVEMRQLYPSDDGRLSDAGPGSGEMAVCSPVTTGLTSGPYYPGLGPSRCGARPAGRRRGFAGLRCASARGAARPARGPGGGPRACRRPASRAHRRQAVPRGARRDLAPHQLRPSQPHPPRQPCRAGGAGARAVLQRPGAARRHRLPRPGRASPAPGRVDGLLADDLAGARGRHRDGKAGGQPAATAAAQAGRPAAGRHRAGQAGRAERFRDAAPVRSASGASAMTS
jgi:hypothetical protein